MPLPIAQPNTDETEDTAGLQPMADPGSSYSSRFNATLEGSLIGSAYEGAAGAYYQRDGSDILSKEDAENQFGNGGLTKFDEPVSKDYAMFKASQDSVKNTESDTLARAGKNSAQNTWLGFGLSTAASMLDPIGDGLAILSDGITKFAPMRPGFLIGPATSRLASRAAQGVQSAVTFSALSEPIHAMVDDHWSVSEAAQRLGGAALFMGLSEGLFGHTPLKAYAEDKDVAPPGQAEVYDALTDRLQPETQAAMAQAVVARTKAGKDLDIVNDLVGLDPRIAAHEAKLGGVQLSMEERLAVLESMDNGTYKDPVGNPVDHEGNEITPEEQAAIQKELEGDSKVTLEPHEIPNAHDGQAPNLKKPEAQTANIDEIIPPQKDVNQPATKSEPPTIDIQAKAIPTQQLISQRVGEIQRKLMAEANQHPPALPIGRSPLMPKQDLTGRDKDTTLLLQPYESPERVQNEQTKQLQLEDKKSEVVNATERETPQADDTSSFGSGAGFYGLSRESDNARGSIRNIKGVPVVIHPHGKVEHPTLESALEHAKGLGYKPKFVKLESANPDEVKAKALAKRQEKERQEALAQRVEEHHLEQEFPTKVVSHSLPNLSTEDIIRNVLYHEKLNALNQLHKDLDKLGWEKIGVGESGKGYDYLIRKADAERIYNSGEENLSDGDQKLYYRISTDEYLDKASAFEDLPQEVRDILPKDTNYLAKSKEEYENEFQAKGGIDETRMNYYVYQLPVMPEADFMQQFHQIRLVQDESKAINYANEADHFWTANKQDVAHAHFAILKDIAGEKYVGIFEMQGHKLSDEAAKLAGTMPRWEAVRRLALEVKAFADKEGLPVVIADAETASRVYRGTNEPVSKILAEAYGTKNGYVPKGMKRAWQMKGQPLKEFTGGSDLWMPFESDKEPFSGYVMPDNSDLNLMTTSERIDKVEGEREPGYEQAINCVTKTD